MASKLISLPTIKSHNVTWGEAMKGFLDTADEETKAMPIRNLVIITDTAKEYSFGILNETELRSLLGSVECVKAYIIECLMGVMDLED